MTYEYQAENGACIEVVNKMSGTEHLSEPMVNELDEVYHKAEILNKVKNFTTERLKEEETTDEYDYGERFICKEIKRLLEEN